MAFHYDFTGYPAISQVRLLVGDTDSAHAIWSDEEITGAITIQGAQFGGRGAVSALRVAALLLDGLAANKSRLSTTRLLDANVDPHGAAKALRDQARQYREVDDDSLALSIIDTRRGCLVDGGYLL